MAIIPSSRPARDPPHLEPLAFRPPDQLSAWEYHRKLLAELIRRTRSLLRRRDQNLGRSGGVDLAREVPRERVGGDVCCILVLRQLLRLVRRRGRRGDGLLRLFWCGSGG
jgi:hypothetical protein